MARKAYIAIIASMLLVSLMPIAHAQQGPLGVQADLLHTSKDVRGNLLPHFAENPSTGIGMSAEYPIGLAVFSGSINTTTTRLWSNDQVQDGTNGHTSIVVAAKRRIDKVHLSAQHMYMHTSMPSKQDHFQNDKYETLLKATLAASSTRKPYIFIGFLAPAHIPIEEMIGMGGVGLATRTQVQQNMAITTDTAIATTLVNVGQEPETTLRSKIALEIEPRDAVKLQVGFNLFQDMQRKKYYTWGNVGVSYAF